MVFHYAVRNKSIHSGRWAVISHTIDEFTNVKKVNRSAYVYIDMLAPCMSIIDMAWC